MNIWQRADSSCPTCSPPRPRRAFPVDPEKKRKKIHITNTASNANAEHVEGLGGLTLNPIYASIYPYIHVYMHTYVYINKNIDGSSRTCSPTKTT